MPSTLIALWLAATPSLAAPDLRGQSHLDRRQFRLAAESFRAALQQRPDDPELRLGLAQAWAGLLWCERALPVFEELHDSPFLHARAALDHGACLLALGQDEEGIAVLEEAVELSGQGSGARTQLGWEAFKLGDLDRLQAVAEGLIEEDPDGRGALLLRAAVAYAEGDREAQSQLLTQLRRAQPDAPQADLLDAWQALEDGAPALAAQVLSGEGRLHRVRLPEVAVWLAEANRRSGQLGVARQILQQQARTPEPTVLRQAIELRVRADGEGPQAAADAARALATAHPWQPEAVATAWYLAQLQGSAEAEAWARRYALLPWAERRPLTLLLPPATPPHETP